MTTAPGVLIGVDVGCTTLSGGLVTAEGKVLSAIQAPTRLGSGTAVHTILGIVADLHAEAQVRGLAVEAVGVGIPGLVDAERGLLLSSAGSHVADLHRVPLAERIFAKIGVPTFVDNDVNALALGEWMFGLGRGAASCVVLAVGSALGAGIILEGRLVRGKSGFAGEFGHAPIDLDGPRCPCGGRGCLALYVGGEYIGMEARRRIVDEASSLLALAGGEVGAITAQTVFAAAAAGDGLARSMVDRACRAMGAGIAMVVNGLNPEVVIITGGVVQSLVTLRGEIIRRVAEYTLADSLAGTPIHFVPGDKSQTVRGGAALVLYERARRAATPADRSEVADVRLT